MHILYGFLLVVHVLVSLLLIVGVLMQASKGGGLAGIAGGAAAQAAFGGRQAATLLHKVTIVLAVVFGINCLLLSVLSKAHEQVRSVTQESLQDMPASPLDYLGGEEAPAAEQGGTEALPVAPGGE